MEHCEEAFLLMEDWRSRQEEHAWHGHRERTELLVIASLARIPAECAKCNMMCFINDK